MQDQTRSSRPVLTLVELRVLEGLSRGASLPLDEALTIGHDESSDLLLMDDGVVPGHARISPRDDGFALEIRAPAGEASTVQQLALGEPFLLGAARLVCCSTDTPWDAMFASNPRSSTSQGADAAEGGPALLSRRSRLPVLLGGLAFLMLVVAGLLWLVSQDIAPAPAAVRDAPPAPVDAATLAQWAHEIDRRLQAANLSGLEARAYQEAVRISGTAAGTTLPRLEQILKSARRERPGIQIVLQLKEAPPEPPPFRVKALVGGPHPRALLDEGLLLYPGDRHAGLLLVAINGTCLTLMQETDQQRVQVCLDQIRQPS